MADVTVVVPTRNRLDCLQVTLARILAQRDAELRVIVVDEASSDGTVEYLTRLAKRDERIAFIRHDEPKGVGPARNAGLALVETPWVAFCDDDDLWAPHKLVSQLAAIAEVPGARWSCTGVVLVNPDLSIRGHQRAPAPGDIAEQMKIHNVVSGSGSSLLVETALALDVGGYDAWFTGCEDYAFATAVAHLSPVATVDRPLVAYRIWMGGMSANVPLMRQGHERVLARWSGSPSLAFHRNSEYAMEVYLGSLRVRNRARLAGFLHHSRFSVRFHRPRSMLTAIGLLLVPSVIAGRHDRQGRQDIPADWLSEAVAWLTEEPPELSC